MGKRTFRAPSKPLSPIYRTADLDVVVFRNARRAALMTGGCQCYYDEEGRGSQDNFPVTGGSSLRRYAYTK